MTETNPEGARPTAGRVGVHRQNFAEPVTEPESLNIAPQRRTAPQAEERGYQRDDVARVRQDIERTRDDLGDTIEALAAKADVRARAQERMHATATMAREKAAGVADRVRSVTPEPVRGAAGKVTEKARRRPGMTAASVGAAAAGLIIVRGITRMTESRRATPALRAAHIGPIGRIASIGRTGIGRIAPIRRTGPMSRIGRIARGTPLTGATRAARTRRRIARAARMGRIARMTPMARTSPMSRMARMMGMTGMARRGRRTLMKKFG